MSQALAPKILYQQYYKKKESNNFYEWLRICKNDSVLAQQALTPFQKWFVTIAQDQPSIFPQNP
jgi:hypothetical protein